MPSPAGWPPRRDHKRVPRRPRSAPARARGRRPRRQGGAPSDGGPIRARGGDILNARARFPLPAASVPPGRAMLLFRIVAPRGSVGWSEDAGDGVESWNRLTAPPEPGGAADPAHPYAASDPALAHFGGGPARWGSCAPQGEVGPGPVDTLPNAAGAIIRRSASPCRFGRTRGASRLGAWRDGTGDAGGVCRSTQCPLRKSPVRTAGPSGPKGPAEA